MNFGHGEVRNAFGDLISSINPTNMAGLSIVIERAFDEGYDDGYEAGYADGYRDGFRDGVDSVR